MFILSLQALPCTTAFIEANQQLKADHCMGIIVDKFPLNYESFNDKVASGKIHDDSQIKEDFT